MIIFQLQDTYLVINISCLKRQKKTRRQKSFEDHRPWGRPCEKELGVLAGGGQKAEGGLEKQHKTFVIEVFYQSPEPATFNQLCYM
jgi:hypothetical protein